ncbi:hypothetical protein ACFSUS_24585 [Spirosoma soli]|uniref:DUF3592 domain-containing protein n=1 Tax=Spirosoma soli TaxID=1770529 RepID=A0ABW5M9Z3_9BACT
MLRNLFRLLGRVYTAFWALVMTALLAAATWVMWYLYQAERLDSKFAREGQLVKVQIKETDRNPRMFLDQFGNAVYVRFNYRNQTYKTRCANDSTWLSAGDHIQLLYHPGLDKFQPPQRARTATPTRVRSRLIEWSSMVDFSREHQLLGGFILAALALFFVGGGAIVTLTSWTFIQTIARFVLLAALGVAALFFTYDTIQYFQYFQSLRANGRAMEVDVTDTDRTNHSRRSRSHWYTYDATFRFQGQERVVAIDEDDYERLNGTDRKLRVLYNSSLNDFIAVDYSPAFSQLLLPLFFWFLFGLLVRNSLSTPKPVRP